MVTEQDINAVVIPVLDAEIFDLTDAIALADRVVLVSQRPGHVVREYSIDLPRPRRVMDVKFLPRFVELEQAIWHDLQTELRRGEERA